MDIHFELEKTCLSHYFIFSTALARIIDLKILIYHFAAGHKRGSSQNTSKHFARSRFESFLIYFR